jgi:hypothetical protein
MDSQLPNLKNLSLSLIKRMGFFIEPPSSSYLKERRTMNKLTLIVIGTCMIFAMPLPSKAEPSDSDRQAMKEKYQAMHQEREERHKAMEQERQAFKEKMEGYKQQMEQLRGQMQQEMVKVKEIRGQMEAVHKEMEEARQAMYDKWKSMHPGNSEGQDQGSMNQAAPSGTTSSTTNTMGGMRQLMRK